MDMTLVREVTTVVTFITFLAILFYALHPRNKARFEEEAKSVLSDDDTDETLAPALCQGRGRRA